MLVVLQSGAERGDAERVATTARDLGYHADVVEATTRLGVVVSGGVSVPAAEAFSSLPRVELVDPSPTPYFLASRVAQPGDTVIEVGGVEIGGTRVAVMAGPCAVESEDQVFAVAERARKAGVSLFRGGAWKLRTSPWSFQGLERRGLEILAEVKRTFGLSIITEVVSETTLAEVAAVADVVQVGARNMKNYALLKEVGRCGRPVLLKRGFDALLSELLTSAEYLLAAGARDVILCERGIRTFSDHSRNTLDLSAVPALKQRTHLPVVVDPSHGTGLRSMVVPLSRAAVAAGADGLLVEVHPDPGTALCDGPQALTPDDLDQLVRESRAVARAIGRDL